MNFNNLREKFWELPLNELSDIEWEALCDGCGRCCLKKFIDDETEELLWTRVVCKYFDNKSGKCSCYEQRTQLVADCLNVRELIPAHIEWMPPTCAYRLRANDKPLFDWHPLLSKDNSAVSTCGISILGKSISEENVHPTGFLEHVIRWVDGQNYDNPK